jgi:Yip1-like protein
MSSQATPQYDSVPDAPAPLSEISRLTGVFASPKQAFTDIVARPKWFVPVILGCVMGLIFVTLVSQHVGFDRIVQQQLDQNPKTQNMTAEQRAQAVRVGGTVTKVIVYVSAVSVPPLFALIVGGVLMFLANSMLGLQLRYGQMCAISAYASLTGLVSGVLTIVVMFIRSPEDFDIKNPLAFNVGAFLNADSTAKWLMSLATSLDVFSFWTMALLAIGIVAGSRKLSFGKAFMTVLIPWAIYVIGKAGLVGIFS